MNHRFTQYDGAVASVYRGTGPKTGNKPDLSGRRLLDDVPDPQRDAFIERLKLRRREREEREAAS